MSKEPGEGSESQPLEATTATEAERPTEAVAPEAETPQQVIEIHAPPPFGEDALEPFIDLYMEKRGLTNRKQAAVSLARVLWKLGWNPQRDIQNVTAYINNLSGILDTMPDTPETSPVKGSLMARGAAKMSTMLDRTHFGEPDEMQEMKEMMRFATKARVTMRMLDQAFSGDQMSSGESQTSKEIKELRQKIEKREEQDKFEALLGPIKQQLSALNETIKDIAKKPKTEEESEVLKELRGSIGKINDRLDKKEEADALGTTLKGVRDDLKELGEKITKGGGGKSVEVTDAFDQAVNLMDKIKEAIGKMGGGEGDLDWKTAAITTFGEMGTEAIRAAKDIMSGKEGEEEAAPAPKAKEPPKEAISERIIDHKVLGFIQEQVSTGAKELNTKDAAAKLKLTEKQVFDSYQRLEAKGLITTGGKPPQQKGETPGAAEQPSTSWVEG